MRISDWSSDVCSSDLLLASDVVNFAAKIGARLGRKDATTVPSELSLQARGNILDDRRPAFCKLDLPFADSRVRIQCLRIVVDQGHVTAAVPATAQRAGERLNDSRVILDDLRLAIIGIKLLRTVQFGFCNVALLASLRNPETR